jgi:hypothetical protein
MSTNLSKEEEYAIRKDIKRAMEIGDGSGELAARKKLMDFDSGANYNARALIGSAATMDDKIATARKFYPDAKRYGDDNIVFTNPKTNRKTLVNPEGLDWGDIPGASREISQVAGGLLGSAAGVLGGPWGMAVGGALGSQIAGQGSDAINRMMGTVETRGLPRIAAEGAVETALETVVGKIGEGLPLFLRQTKEKIGDVLLRSGVSERGAAQTLADLQASGIPLEGAAGTVGSSSKAIRNIEKALSNMPGSSGVMDAAAAKTLGGAEEAHRKLAASFGRVMTPEGAGTVIKEGMHGAAGRFKATRTRLDDEVSRLLPEGEPIIPPEKVDHPPSPVVDADLVPPVAPTGELVHAPRTEQIIVGSPIVVGQTQAPGGKIFKAFDESGGSIDGQFTVVDADKLVTSNFPEYPPSLQPRDRTRAASDFVVGKISKRLNPALLGDSPLVSQGAPIIGTDGIVESGNGRIMAIRKAYQAGNADEYRKYLSESAPSFGIAPESITGMAKPVLVRVRTTPLDDSARQEFTQRANQSSIAAFSPAENAAKDAGHVPSMEGLAIENPQDLLLLKNSDFVRAFFKKAVSDAEIGSVMDSKGRLSSAGFNRLKAAIYSKAYGVGDGSVISRLSESLDDNIKNVTAGMLTAAPKIASMVQKIERGDLHSLGISSEIAEAAEELSRLRGRGLTVAENAKQGELFGGKKDPVVQELLEVFERFGGGHKKIGEFLSRYVDQVELVGSPKQGNLFDDAPVLDKLDLISTVNKQMEREYGPQTIVPVAKKTDSVVGPSTKKIVDVVGDHPQKPATDMKGKSDKKASSRLTKDQEDKVKSYLPELLRLRDSLKARHEKAPLSLAFLGRARNEVEKILVDAVNGKMDIVSFRLIRTKVGNQTQFGQLYTGPLQKTGHDTYHAIRVDLVDIATKMSPEAGAALRNHDKYVTAYNKVREPVINDIIKKETGEQVWNYAKGISKDGGSRLRAIRKNLLPAEWDIVAATTLHRMGLGLPGSQNVAGDAFRHSTFFSNWSKLSPEAKTALFSGTRYNEMVEPLNRLVRVSASLKELDTAINSSNTATAATWIQLLQSPKNLLRVVSSSSVAGAAFFAPAALTVAGAVLGIAGPYLTAKVWTNPEFVKWLASGGQMRRVVTDSDFKRMMLGGAARLRTLSGDDDERQAFQMMHKILTSDNNEEK